MAGDLNQGNQCLKSGEIPFRKPFQKSMIYYDMTGIPWKKKIFQLIVFFTFTCKGDVMMFNVLVVDDESVQREGIKDLISHYGFPFQVLEAENGISAE